jgi:hypothetical protein
LLSVPRKFRGGITTSVAVVWCFFFSLSRIVNDLVNPLARTHLAFPDYIRLDTPGIRGDDLGTKMYWYWGVEGPRGRRCGAPLVARKT